MTNSRYWNKQFITLIGSSREKSFGLSINFLSKIRPGNSQLFRWSGRAITDRWCFKLKKNCNNPILKYKARWVTHVFKQKWGIGCMKIFKSVVKLMSYRYVFGVSVKCGYKIWQMDVITTLWYRFLNEFVSVE